MSKNVSEKNKRTIRNLFKELIKVYKTKKYKEEILQAKPSKNDIPTFHLRFFKRGEESIYYRVLLNQKEIN